MDRQNLQVLMPAPVMNTIFLQVGIYWARPCKSNDSSFLGLGDGLVSINELFMRPIRSATPSWSEDFLAALSDGSDLSSLS